MTLCVGEKINFTCRIEDMNCSCLTKNGDRCTNQHKFLYKFSNGEIMKSCGIKRHKKYIHDTYTYDKKLSYDLYRVYQEDYIITIEEITNLKYIVMGVNVDHTFHYNNPLVKLNTPLSEIKEDLEYNLESNKDDIAYLEDDIESLRRKISELNRQMLIRKSESEEIRLAMIFVNTNTVYKPSIIENDDNESCSICCCEMTKETSGRLYECSHVFHHDCIKKWFLHKDSLTCPICRTECNHDIYFVLNTK